MLIVKYPVRNVCTNYKLKIVQNKFVKEISFPKTGLWMYCLYMTWNCPHDSKNHEDMICFEETGGKMTFKT